MMFVHYSKIRVHRYVGCVTPRGEEMDNCTLTLLPALDRLVERQPSPVRFVPLATSVRLTKQQQPNDRKDSGHIGVRPTLGELQRTHKLVLLCNPPKWDAPVPLTDIDEHWQSTLQFPQYSIELFPKKSAGR